MPRDANGNYSLPLGYLAVDGATIQPSQHNPPLEDIAAGLSNSLPRNGTAPMTAPLKLADGLVGSPSLAFASSASTGLFKTTNGYAVTINGTQVAEFGSSGLLSGVVTGSIADQAVTLPKIAAPGATGILIGSNANPALTITGIANNGSGLIRLTVADTSTFATGQSKTVAGVLGTTEANGGWSITVVSATQIDLQSSTFVNAYVSGGTIGGGWDRVTLGRGLSMGGASGAVLSGAAPLPGAVGLVIANNAGTPNSKIDISADYATLLAGTASFLAVGVALTIDTSTVGVPLGLDTGSRAANTWYHIFLISNGTATSALVSLSATAPTLPTGYTYAVRVGAMMTDGSGNFYRTLQRGRDAVYAPVTASNTIGPRVMTTSTASAWTGLSVSNFVPPTATKIRVTTWGGGLVSSTLIALAPNSNYPTTNGGSTPTSICSFENTGTGQINALVATEMVLESSNTYYASNAASSALSVYGWTDKVNAS